MLIGHFDTDGRLSGYRRLDTDIHRRETEFDVVGKIHDLADLDALFGLKLIPCDGGSLADIGDRHIDAESPQGLLKSESGLLEFPVRLSVVSGLSFLEKLERRETVLAVLLASGLTAGHCSSRAAVFVIAAVSVNFDTLQVLVSDRFPRLRLIRFLPGCNCSSDWRRRSGSVLLNRKRCFPVFGLRESCFLRFYGCHLFLRERVGAPWKFIFGCRSSSVCVSLRLGVKG